MGVTMRWHDSEGVEHDVLLLGVENLTIHYAEKIAAAVPDDVDLEFGSQQVLWETPWLDMGAPERMKDLIHLDVVLGWKDGVTQSGNLQASIFVDGDLSVARHTQLLDLGGANPVRVTPKSMNGMHFKLRIEHAAGAQNLRFDIASLVWRISPEGQD
jgi:hypothetical protein